MIKEAFAKEGVYIDNIEVADSGEYSYFNIVTRDGTGFVFNIKVREFKDGEVVLRNIAEVKKEIEEMAKKIASWIT